MSEKRLTDQQAADLIRAVKWSEVSMEQAAQVLGAAVQQCHDSEAGLEALRGAIAQAEAALIYGAAGRPKRQYPPTWGVTAESLEGLSRRTFSADQLPTAFYQPRAAPDQ